MKLGNNNNNRKEEETERRGVGAPPGTQVRVQVLGPACSLHVAFATPHSRVPRPLAQARWRGRGAPSYNTQNRPSLPPHWRPLASVVGDGEAAEDGQAAAGVQAGGLGAAEAAGAQGAAQVAVAVRQRVRGAGGRVEHGRLGQAARQLVAEGRRGRRGAGGEGRAGWRRGLRGGHQALLLLLLLLAAIVGGGRHGGEVVGLDGEWRDEAGQLGTEGEGVVGARGRRASGARGAGCQQVFGAARTVQEGGRRRCRCRRGGTARRGARGRGGRRGGGAG